MEENKEIKEAVEELDEMSQDEELKRLAFLKEKYIRDERSAQRYFREQGLEEGRAEGREEGRKKGLAEGRKEGREEGREEGRAEGSKQKAEEIAKNMIKEGIKIETISKVTGLDEKEIKNMLSH